VIAVAMQMDWPARTLLPRKSPVQGSQQQLLFRLIDNGELYTPFLKEHHTRSWITLRVDLPDLDIHNSSGYTAESRKAWASKGAFLRGFLWI